MTLNLKPWVIEVWSEETKGWRGRGKTMWYAQPHRPGRPRALRSRERACQSFDRDEAIRRAKREIDRRVMREARREEPSDVIYTPTGPVPPEKVPGVENMSTPPRPSQPLSATTAAIHSVGDRHARLAFLQDRAEALRVEGVRGTDRWMGESVDRWEERLNELGHRGAPES
jgi:hypothetical protein